MCPVTRKGGRRRLRDAFLCNEVGAEGSNDAKNQELRGRSKGEEVILWDLRAKNSFFGKRNGNVGKGCSFCVRFGSLRLLVPGRTVLKGAETGRLQFLCKVSGGRNGAAAEAATVFV